MKREKKMDEARAEKKHCCVSQGTYVNKLHVKPYESYRLEKHENIRGHNETIFISVPQENITWFTL